MTSDESECAEQQHFEDRAACGGRSVVASQAACFQQKCHGGVWFRKKRSGEPLFALHRRPRRYLIHESIRVEVPECPRTDLVGAPLLLPVPFVVEDMDYSEDDIFQRAERMDKPLDLLLPNCPHQLLQPDLLQKLQTLVTPSHIDLATIDEVDAGIVQSNQNHEQVLEPVEKETGAAFKDQVSEFKHLLRRDAPSRRMSHPGFCTGQLHNVKRQRRRATLG